MSHFQSCLQFHKIISASLATSVEETSLAVSDKIHKKFDYKSELIGLLLGNIQSGKTAQILGIIAKLADKSFEVFILLTTDNIHLHKQTKERTAQALATFFVYGETDEIPFRSNQLAKPIVVVLKKNAKVLKKWRDYFSSSQYCSGRPIVIIDDEADAASLNTLVNKRETSTINKHLSEIKNLAAGCLFLQVTATPQAILLQSNISKWKPAFVHYFRPGKEYVGGDFIYSQPQSYCIKLTAEDELNDIKNSLYTPKGFQAALLSFLVVCSQFALKGGKTCNFLVHPSVKISDHDNVANELGECLNSFLLSTREEASNFTNGLKEQWLDLQKSKPDIEHFDDIVERAMLLLEDQSINVIILNSRSSRDINYQTGFNIIVGGNSLGRGVTFPAIQTVYYCRKSKTPQADTCWQHARMFGYDRDKALLRCFLPSSLYQLFFELNVSNKLLIGQVENNIDGVQLIYPNIIKPTRRTVLDNSALNLIVGGVNFFASNPSQTNVTEIDALVGDFGEKEKCHVVPADLLVQILMYTKNIDPHHWNNIKFITAVQALALKRPLTKCALIIRRNRNISKGTGTLLAPTDRAIGDKLSDSIVLTLYKVNGSAENGWQGNPFYIPNIKLPEGICIYDTIEI